LIPPWKPQRKRIEHLQSLTILAIHPPVNAMKLYLSSHLMNDQKSQAGSPGILWRLLFAFFIALLLASCGTLAFMFFQGGIAKVIAFYLVQTIPPFLGVVSLIFVGINMLVTPRWNRWALVTGLISLGAISPALLIVFPVTYPASIEKMTPSATVRLPTDTPLKVAWGGDNVKVNYHAMTPDQRWAYDLIMEPRVNGSARLEDYSIYGVPVVAPASGQIAVVHAGEPDEKPGVPSNNTRAIAGNYVAIRLPTQTYLIIAHLRKGSLLVKEGDFVNEGQKIAECGNSGNTSEPHIHIHHQRQNPKDYPIGFAEGLPLLFRDHDGPPMPLGGWKNENGARVWTGPTVRNVKK